MNSEEAKIDGSENFQSGSKLADNTRGAAAKTSICAIAGLICSVLLWLYSITVFVYISVGIIDLVSALWFPLFNVSCLVALTTLGLILSIFGILETRKRFNKKGRGLAIIGVVISLLFIVLLCLLTLLMFNSAIELTHMTTDKAKEVRCRANLALIGTACQLYALDNNKYFPDNDISQLYKKYVPNAGSLVAPCSGRPFEYVADLKVDFRDDLLLAYEDEAGHDGKRNVLLLGGDVKTMDEEEFQQALDKTNKFLEEREKGISHDKDRP